jgi:hypothetical protein
MPLERSITGEGPRRDAPLTCRKCGARVTRKGRRQAYCSRKCRQQAYWDRRAIAKLAALRTSDTSGSTTPPKSRSNINGLQGRKSRPTSPFSVPLNLLGGGQWRWPGTTRLDGETRAKITCAEIGDRRCACGRLS